MNAHEIETLTMQVDEPVTLEEELARALQAYNTAALASQNAAAKLIALGMRARDELAAHEHHAAALKAIAMMGDEPAHMRSLARAALVGRGME